MSKRSFDFLNNVLPHFFPRGYTCPKTILKKRGVKKEGFGISGKKRPPFSSNESTGKFLL